MRAAGFSRCTRWMALRTSSSAAAVTVQVFSTTSRASDVSAAAVRPWASSADSSAAPSACEARHPKLWTWKLDTAPILTAGAPGSNSRRLKLKVHERHGGFGVCNEDHREQQDRADRAIGPGRTQR